MQLTHRRQRIVSFPTRRAGRQKVLILSRLLVLLPAPEKTISSAHVAVDIHHAPRVVRLPAFPCPEYRPTHVLRHSLLVRDLVHDVRDSFIRDMINSFPDRHDERRRIGRDRLVEDSVNISHHAKKSISVHHAPPVVLYLFFHCSAALAKRSGSNSSAGAAC